MDEVISQISHERFGGNQILFLDSASKLRNQLHAVDVILERFNKLAQGSGSENYLWKRFAIGCVLTQMHRSPAGLAAPVQTCSRVWRRQRSPSCP